MFNFNQTKIFRSPEKNESTGNNGPTQSNTGSAQGSVGASHDTGSEPTTPRGDIFQLRSSQNPVPGAPNINDGRLARPRDGRETG